MAALGVYVLLVVVDTSGPSAFVRHLRNALGGLAVAVLAYAVVWKVCSALVARAGERGELADDLGAKWDWLVDVVGPRILHPFSMSNGAALSGFLVAALIVVAPWRRSEPWWFNAARSLLVVLGIVACYLPNLAVRESWARSRS
ncbi:unnamed protein product, partial [Phaeothamnion confervicola]